MRRQKQKILVIVGATASGKSGLAVSLARRFDGEVISADSRQVYRGLDLGTGKISKYEMRGVPHHLLDIADPGRRPYYSAGDFARDAERAFATISERGRLPIIAGGTGFYIDAALGAVTLPDVPPNPALRKRLEAREAASLFRELQKRDPKRALHIDPHNKRRLVRALEITLAKKPVPSRAQKERTAYDVLTIGIKLPDEALKKKIKARLLARLKRGMIAEAKRLRKKGLSFKRMEELGLEYRFLSRYLRGVLTREEMTDQLEKAIVRYAKRQKRWFSYNKKTHWFAPTEIKQIKKTVASFLAS